MAGSVFSQDVILSFRIACFSSFRMPSLRRKRRNGTIRPPQFCDNSSGSGCSKQRKLNEVVSRDFVTSLITKSIAVIFLLKNVRSFCTAKVSHVSAEMEGVFTYMHDTFEI